MAVPKRKTYRAKRGQRRAHDALKRVNITVNKTTGEYSLPHNMSLDGWYKEEQIVKKAKKEKAQT